MTNRFILIYCVQTIEKCIKVITIVVCFYSLTINKATGHFLETFVKKIELNKIQLGEDIPKQMK